MQIHEVQPKTKQKQKKRVGRGGKRGTYSGKGMKGQKSRAGAKMKPIIRESLKQYPKLRGYKFSPLTNVFAVNISILDRVFDDGSTISPKTLKEKGILAKGKKMSVKILGNGETKKKFFVTNCTVSKKAKEEMQKTKSKETKVQNKVKK
jgi:large subunit ribosomal protein L15